MNDDVLAPDCVILEEVATPGPSSIAGSSAGDDSAREASFNRNIAQERRGFPAPLHTEQYRPSVIREEEHAFEPLPAGVGVGDKTMDREETQSRRQCTST